MPNTKITTTGDEVKIDMDEENTDTEEIEGGVEQKKSVAVAAACIISTTVLVAMIILNKAIVLSIPFGWGVGSVTEYSHDNNHTIIQTL